MFTSFIQRARFLFTRRFGIGAIVWITYVLPIMPAGGAEPVTVSLESGRAFTGEVDPKTNAQKLWLRFGAANSQILRPIDWDRVAKATQGEKTLTNDDLQALAKAAADAAPPMEIVPPLAFHGVFAEPSKESLMEKAERAAIAALPPMRSLTADALIANWDSDVENDGVVVQLYPLDRNREVVPVSGTLEVELFAPELRRSSDAVHARGVSMQRIGRWTQAVNVDEFSNRGLSVELPFQGVHPEFSDRTLPYGIVHVRLLVPGQGTFDTTLDYVRIRPWSPLRDGMWRNEGRRFLSTERTGRGKSPRGVQTP
ncbi:MAG TPA: hypothetical protein VL096_11555 [Pirellulaceae bacterium]|nr:hypothetical protein [Pirellulaceae bacterium]